MTAVPCYYLSDRARQHALALYWRDALSLVEPRFDIMSHVERVRAHGRPYYKPVDLEDVARLLLDQSGWLFNHLGERIA